MKNIIFAFLMFITFNQAEAAYRSLEEKTSFFAKAFKGFEGGYEDVSLGGDEFLVTYHMGDLDRDPISHPFSTPETMEKNNDAKALRRAGELTHSLGYRYFKIIEKDSGEYVSGKGYGPVGRYMDKWTYISVLRIKGFHEQVEGEVYDSYEVATWKY